MFKFFLCRSNSFCICGGISTGLKRIRADEPETSKGKRLLSPERKRPITDEGKKQWRLPENRGNLIGILIIIIILI